MKLYRKSKDYKKELAIINKALKAYRAYYKTQQPAYSKKIDELSARLNISLGLTDKKGSSLYEPEPLGKWNKRKIIVEKKLDK